MGKKIFQNVIFVFFLLIILNIPCVSKIPESLKGIWNGNDRIMFIGENGDFSIILKVYNGWYFDRASESSGFEVNSSRERNAASSKSPIIVSVDFIPLIDEKDKNEANAYEMILSDKKDVLQRIPIAVSENKIYLDFFIRNSTIFNDDNLENSPNILENLNDSSSVYGYWEAVNKAENIRLSAIKKDENIYSYFILPDSTYKIRFWKTDMEYDENARAFFTDGERRFTINKHIFSCGENFTVTQGRRSQIRNVEKSQEIPFAAKLDETGYILLRGNENFTKMTESSKESLLEIVKEANSRKKPNPPLLFPESDLDFHWDLIDSLEKDNKIIQEVRKRQEEFGPRGKDRNK